MSCPHIRIQDSHCLHCRVRLSGRFILTSGRFYCGRCDCWIVDELLRAGHACLRDTARPDGLDEHRRAR